MSFRDVIFCEDKYGKTFLKALAERLKSSNLLSNRVGIDVEKFYGACNVKLERQLLAKEGSNYQKISILVDSDGKIAKRILSNRVQMHIPQTMNRITTIIVFDYEIEDWLCIGLGIRLNARSSDIMKKRFGYEKHMLPSYVPKLNINRLMQLPSFQSFVSSL